MTVLISSNRISIATDGPTALDTMKMMGDYFEQDGQLRKTRGLGWLVAAFFVVADMAGGGIVALPTAVVRCQFFPGLLLLTAMALVATHSAVMLGKCWEILLRRFPMYRTHCRNPYAEIGFRALGPKMRWIVSTCINFTQFGVSTVFLLLCSKNIHDFMHAFFQLDIGFCLVILVVALCLFPVTLLKSPNDFWGVVVCGMLTTGMAIVLVCLGAVLDFGTCAPIREFPSASVGNYLYALGTMMFIYGGHSAFPTIQHDMRKPSEFSKSVILGFIIMSIFNLSAVSTGGLVYGNSLRDSMINSIQTVWIQQAVNLMITAHCLLTLTLIINPLDQEVEEFFGVPHHFGWKRVLVRATVLVTILFVAESVPSFGLVLDFFGGSTVALTSVVFPCTFYLFLSASEKKATEKEHLASEEPPTFLEMLQRTERRTLILYGLIIVVSSLVGIIATLSALKELVSTKFTTPCYLRPLFPAKMPSSLNGTVVAFLPSSTNCCGPEQNVSRYGLSSRDHCTAPDLHFY